MINSKYPLVLLSDIAVIYNGNSINKRIKQEKYTGLSQGRNFIATKDIDFDGTVNYENGVKIPFAESSFKTAPADCVFVCSEGGSAGKKTAYITQEVCFGNKLYAIVGKNDSFVGKYVYYFTRYSGFSSQFKDLLNGIIGGVSLKNFGSIQIPYPEKEIQESIVERIENQLSQLDSAVETLKETKQQLEVYRDTVLKSAFTGSYPSKPLAEISKAISGYAFKSKLYDNSGRYTVVKIGNVKNYHFDFSRDNTRTNEFDERIIEKYLLKHGDCVITLTGSRGKRDYGFVAMINDENDYMLNQRVAALRFDISVAYPKFFMYYLSSIDYRNKFFSYETGNVGQGNVGIKALIEPEVLVPSLQEQMRIVKRIESQLSVCDSIEQTVNQSLQQAEALRQSILKQAFERRVECGYHKEERV